MLQTSNLPAKTIIGFVCNKAPVLQLGMIYLDFFLMLCDSNFVWLDEWMKEKKFFFKEKIPL